MTKSMILVRGEDLSWEHFLGTAWHPTYNRNKPESRCSC